ncbi:alpha/beta hydrolase [Agreia pratensis]|uniref:alpha/beta hydrolase n=1 Tax=Agreia pratensis TaxID=150121 RepID=UPI00188A0613|nr:alpha/beta hydrolase [Agreia pratensis]MBF4633372.1 alpha/beta hydrolase [Agreia pratensis]
MTSRRSAGQRGDVALTVVGAAALAALAAGIAAAAWKLSPWPSALIVRSVFERDGARVLKALRAHSPGGVDRATGIQYRPRDPHALLDVYWSAGTSAPRPTVIWTHGGAWISGGRANAAPYFELLAAAGFTVVSLDYTRGPASRYPGALHQLNDAHAYLVAHAAELHVDADRIVLAGDSAGAQLSSQLATAITDPTYAAQLGIRPGLAAHRLRGVILHCGIYEMSGLLHSTGIIGWGNRTALRAYVGGLRFAMSPALAEMSMMHRATAAFPPTFISGGNGDPLTDAQAKPFADRLVSLGVDVTRLFWPHDHEPALPHEYQFDLDRPEGLAALSVAIDFVRRHTV